MCMCVYVYMYTWMYLYGGAGTPPAPPLVDVRRSGEQPVAPRRRARAIQEEYRKLHYNILK